MAITSILPTRDPGSGFWAAAERNGYATASVWAIASTAVARVFALTPAEVRDVLDGPAGRFLADDLPFIEGGPTDAEAIEALLRARLCHVGWRRLYEQAISDARTSKKTPDGSGWSAAKSGGHRRRTLRRLAD
jgi:hypothetical protein